jgi:hypothetical protein
MACLKKTQDSQGYQLHPKTKYIYERQHKINFEELSRDKNYRKKEQRYKKVWWEGTKH